VTNDGRNESAPFAGENALDVCTDLSVDDVINPLIGVDGDRPSPGSGPSASATHAAAGPMPGGELLATARGGVIGEAAGSRAGAATSTSTSKPSLLGRMGLGKWSPRPAVAAATSDSRSTLQKNESS
jgi:hypothetical protein